MTEKIFNPDYLLSLCQNYGLRPSKKYGQNFLINSEPVEQMISAANITQDDTVIEIGPGFGPLTFALAPKAGQIIAFEIEKKLEKYWAKHAAENMKIIWGNVLRANLVEVGVPGKYKVVANLPYQITSNVIRKFLEEKNPPTSLTLMVQKEVAERICALPGDMSLLAVSVQYYADAEMVAMVPRTDFWPSPQVDSAVIKITLKDTKVIAEQNQLGSPDAVFKLVRAGFANRRKLLIKNLLPIVGKNRRAELENIFEELGLAPMVRAQELSVEEWIEIAKMLHK